MTEKQKRFAYLAQQYIGPRWHTVLNAWDGYLVLLGYPSDITVYFMKGRTYAAVPDAPKRSKNRPLVRWLTVGGYTQKAFHQLLKRLRKA